MSTKANIVIRSISLEACPLCGASQLRTTLRDGFDFETRTGSYAVIECERCHAQFTNPQPLAEDIPLLYSQRDTHDFDEGSPFVNRLRRFGNLRLIRRLPKEFFEKTSDVLDYGCGSGFFTKVLRDEFTGRVVAADFHDTAPAFVKSSAGIEYLPIAALAESGRKFDVIVCRNVLEHVHSPKHFLAELDDMLKPGGCLLIEVPCRNSVWAKLFGRYYFNHYLPRHLYHFDPRSLRQVLANFDILKCWTAHSPMLGKSIGYLRGTDISGFSLFGLALFPLQVALDTLLGRASLLLAVARTRNS